MSSEPSNPFEAFQFKSEPSETSPIKAKDVSKGVTRIQKIRKIEPPSSPSTKVVDVKPAATAAVKRPVLSLSTEIAAGSGSHYRIIINSLRSWKRTSASTSSVDEYQVFLSELSTVQTDFPFMVLCTGILGSQCRDVVAMRVTKELIAVVGGDLTASALCTLTVERLELVVKSCNYFKSKAKALLKLAAQVSFLGSVPETFKGLTALPGIGPKIANLCLSVAFKHGGDIIVIKENDLDEEEVRSCTASPYFSTSNSNSNSNSKTLDLNSPNLKSSDIKSPEWKSTYLKSAELMSSDQIPNEPLNNDEILDNGEVLNNDAIKSELITKNEIKNEIKDEIKIDTENDTELPLSQHQLNNDDSKTNNSDFNSSSSSSSCSSSSSSYFKNKNSNDDSSSNNIDENSFVDSTTPNKTPNKMSNLSNKTPNKNQDIIDIIDITSPGTGGDRGGIVVDTHVHKVSKRIGWSKGKAPEDTRKVLESLAPYSDWEELTVLLINLGQTLCGPLPQCGKCPLKSYCTYAREVASSGIIIKEKKKAKLKKESNP